MCLEVLIGAHRTRIHHCPALVLLFHIFARIDCFEQIAKKTFGRGLVGKSIDIVSAHVSEYDWRTLVIMARLMGLVFNEDVTDFDGEEY